jgi:cysteinyl-tRNA synthetase
MKLNNIFIGLFFALSLISCGGDDEVENLTDPVSTYLNGIEISTWMYQIQDLDEKEAIDNLYNTPYDMLVVEPGNNFSDFNYDTPYLVSKLQNKPDGDRRILLAYIDIGQAEDYRDYWQSNWKAPTETQPGSPDFLVTIDPDGWSGNYPVAYWDTAWKNLWIGENGIISKLAELGFDGVYLDWVEAYDDDKVREVAEKGQLDAELEMMRFIEEIGSTGKKINSDFLVIPQNAPYLLDKDPDYYVSIIDAIATEDTWFYGEGDADWDDSNAGDLTGGDRHADDYSTENRIAQNKKYLNKGIPVFTIDYCISEQNALKTYNQSRSHGFIPLVTRVSLSEITETPPF